MVGSQAYIVVLFRYAQSEYSVRKSGVERTFYVTNDR